jgi:filamentous hemagglutinin
MFNGVVGEVQRLSVGYARIQEFFGVVPKGTAYMIAVGEPWQAPTFSYSNDVQAMVGKPTEIVAPMVVPLVGEEAVAVRNGGGMRSGAWLDSAYSSDAGVPPVVPDSVDSERLITPGTLSGSPTAIPPLSDAATAQALMRENQSARLLVDNGFDVEQNPTVDGPKNPDYLVNGDVYDNYAPQTGNVRNIASTIDGKVQSGQASNIVVNLGDSRATPEALQAQLTNHPISGLNQVIVIDQAGGVTIIKGN